MSYFLRQVFSVLVVVLTLTGCGVSAPNRPIVDRLDGEKLTFLVSEDWQAVYRRISRYAFECYAMGSTAPFSSQDKRYDDIGQAEVMFLVEGFLNSGSIPKIFTKIKKVSTEQSEVTVTYESSFSGAWAAWADGVSRYARNELTNCPRYTTNPYKPVFD